MRNFRVKTNFSKGLISKTGKWWKLLWRKSSASQQHAQKARRNNGVSSLESSPLMVQRTKHSFPIDCVWFISMPRAWRSIRHRVGAQWGHAAWVEWHGMERKRQRSSWKLQRLGYWQLSRCWGPSELIEPSPCRRKGLVLQRSEKVVGGISFASIFSSSWIVL